MPGGNGASGPVELAWGFSGGSPVRAGCWRNGPAGSAPASGPARQPALTHGTHLLTITAMRLTDALLGNPQVRIFRVTDSESEDKGQWEVTPADAPILSEQDGFFIVKAMNILPDGQVTECYVDVSLPERISDYAYSVQGGSLKVGYHHEFSGAIICAVPIASFGVYELFYSKAKPDIGIGILRNGLTAAAHKAAIAQDLGYILRDERRFQEAAEAFEVAAHEGPSSYFIYGEIADCYEEAGNSALAAKYRNLFENPPAPRP
jgi:hypothetical protein